MADLPIAAQGSGEGMAPVVARGESAAQAAREARANEALQPPPPLVGAALWGGCILLSLANFVVLLDTTIANVSVPTIAGGLGVSANEGTWVITSYAVAEAITVPLTGWLSQRFGSVRVFVTAMGLFGVCSALCGFAPSLGVLVVCRVLQGLAGGPMIPLSQTLLLRIFSKEQAGQALGLWAMTTVVAPIAGPILGGLICDNAHWSWIFFINVPVALVTAALAWRLLRAQEDARVKRPLDLVGLGLMVVWIAALQILLDKGEDEDWFNSAFIVQLALVAGVGFVAFLIWELTDANPIINLRVFRSRSYTICLGVLCLCYGAYFSATVIQPLWLQTNLGYTATWAGYAVAPLGVLAIVMSPIVGRLMRSADPRLLVFIGVMGIAALMFWRSHFNSDINYAQIVLPQALQGACMPLFFVPVFSLGLSSIRPQEMAGAAGILSFARTMAGAFATSLATTAWANGGRASRVQLLNQTDTGGAVRSLMHAGLSQGQALRQFEAMVSGQAVMLATDKLFLTISVLLAIAACSIWLVAKPAGRVASSNSH
ncbi:DHA2 family efflux MFS transporter permease subunit [Caulobacter sp. S45]|uniref:DHA2 family efflux MFS transporter permease subunit n=1 Tax=Caulobacter sp. S45 TaxID=1641861 RepID=UPI0020C5C010|nr:DHA2 family efflux MFS transporter permease subunit [Caulobacter sp. S45]